jgi:hypothetical protein
MSAIQFSGTPAGLTPLRTGESTIPAGASLFAVADTAITTTSIVLATAGGATDATAFLFGVGALVPGVGFNLRANANATADVSVRWVVLKY